MKPPMKSSGFTFDFVNLLYCKCNKIKFNRGKSYLDSLH